MTLTWWLVPLLLLPPLVWMCGNYTFWLPRRDKSWPRLIMLHQVTPLEPASGMNMPPARFEALLRLLRRKGFRFVTVSELVENPGATHCVALTFDDGFADNYEYAFPLLKRFGAKATIYLAAEIDGIDRLSREQIREMYESGLVEFGAHTVSHVNLLRTDDEQARAEIVASRQRVIEVVGRCDSFAYPFGRFDARHEQMVREAGYTSAVTTHKAIAPLTAQNQYHIPRISSHGEMDAWQWRIALRSGRWRL